MKWVGRTEADEPVTVKALGYYDEAWRRAQRDLVRAAIVQAVGRGRGILETGCEVVVLSTEECGLLISDAGMQTLNGSSARVMTALRDLCAQNPNKYYLGNCAPKSTEIAARVGVGLRQIQITLSALERRGLVRKIGERSGWLLTDHPESAESDAPAIDPHPGPDDPEPVPRR